MGKPAVVIAFPAPAVPANLFDPRLWGRPQGEAILERLIVIGPYPSEDFFASLKHLFSPRDVLLVVDEGSGSGALDEMADGVRYASARGGMVHAKLYVAQWKMGGGKRRRRLLWGSANASINGFERHAETLSSMPLPPEAEDYFDEFDKPAGRVKRRLIEADGGLKLVLPGFDFKSSPDPETFEGWLQAGFLCHKYDADQTFARLSVKLHKPLPKALAEKILAGQGLKAAFKSQVMRFAYVPIASESSDDAAKWRPVYFVDNWLGHWTSAECFAAKGRTTFHAKDVQERQRAIRTIARAPEGQRKKWFRLLVTRMQRAATQLRRKRNKPQDFFDMKGKLIDRDAYEERALDQLERHTAQAQKDTFSVRFIRGYDFPPVPPFRGASSAVYSFDGFATSFCDSIVRSWTKGRVQNRLAQEVRRVLAQENMDSDDMTGGQLRQYLSANWSRCGSRVKRFHLSIAEREALDD